MGHPDEIKATKISSRWNKGNKDSIGQVGQADEHGWTRIRKKVYFAFGEKRHIASRQLRMFGHGSAARRFVLICVYRARSRLAWQTGASEAGGSVQICVPQIFKQPSEHSKIMIIIYLINHSTSNLFNQVWINHFLTQYLWIIITCQSIFKRIWANWGPKNWGFIFEIYITDDQIRQ